MQSTLVSLNKSNTVVGKCFKDMPSEDIVFTIFPTTTGNATKGN